MEPRSVPERGNASAAFVNATSVPTRPKLFPGPSANAKTSIAIATRCALSLHFNIFLINGFSMHTCFSMCFYICVFHVFSMCVGV